MNGTHPQDVARPAAAPAPGQTLRAVRTVARDTLREAVRGRWIWLSVLAALAVGAIGAFARALALSEEHAIALAFAAPLARLLAVLIVALSAVASVTREQNDRTLLLALAAPMSRGGWIAGKALGLCVLAAATAVILTLPVLAFGPPPLAAALWCASLSLELALVAAVSLAIGVVITQVPPAVCAVLAFYVFGRDLHVAQLLAERAPNFSELGPAGMVVRAVSLLFPRLDLFTRTEWLLGNAAMPAGAGMLLALAAGYGALALSVAALDLRRRQFN